MEGRFEKDLISAVCHELRGIREEIKTGFETRKSHHEPATKQDLMEMERRIIDMITQDAVDELVALSTLADTFSIRADKADADFQALIASLKSATLTPEQEAAVEKAKASHVALAAAGDKIDAGIASADVALGTPAPAGTP